MKKNITAIMGIQGVHPLENERALKVGRYFSYAVDFALLLVVISLVLPIISPNTFQHWAWVDAFVWLVFTIEFVVNFTLVTHKLRYVKNNWLNLLVVLFASPLFSWSGEWALAVRAIRLVLLIRVVLSIFNILSKILSRNSFGLFLLVALAFLLTSAFIFSQIEDLAFEDSLWYALVTITTVGYGDIVPKTEYGREFGAMMIIFGVILFSIVTANVSAFLVDKEQEKTEHEILQHVKWMADRFIEQERKDEEHLARILSHVSARIETLEKKIEASNSALLTEDLAKLQEVLQNFQTKTTMEERQALEGALKRIPTPPCDLLEKRLERIENKLEQICK